jgi:hypothetical protein
VENAVAHDNVLIESKGIARTTPPAIANNCETEESNRSWQNATLSMEVAWASTVGSSKGRLAGSINFAGFAYDVNDVTMSIKPFSHSAASSSAPISCNSILLDALSVIPREAGRPRDLG